MRYKLLMQIIVFYWENKAFLVGCDSGCNDKAVFVGGGLQLAMFY